MSSNLPINVDTGMTVSTITYANEVIAIIAGMAANEVEGVASMTNASAIADLFGRGKNVTRGVKVEVGTEEASADLMLVVEYGKPIQKVCTEVQEGVKKAIETMTGLHVVRVDVHVTGISFERDTQEMQQGYVKATATDGLFEAREETGKLAAEAEVLDEDDDFLDGWDDEAEQEDAQTGEESQEE